MRFFVDTQLPATLAYWLRDRGHWAKYVLEVNLAQSKDMVIWRYAFEFEAVVITKDEDFAMWVVKESPGQVLYGCVWEIAPNGICLNGLNHCCRRLLPNWQSGSVW